MADYDEQGTLEVYITFVFMKLIKPLWRSVGSSQWQKGNSRRSLYDICVSSIVNNIVFHIGEMSRARTKSLIP